MLLFDLTGLYINNVHHHYVDDIEKQNYRYNIVFVQVSYSITGLVRVIYCIHGMILVGVSNCRFFFWGGAVVLQFSFVIYFELAIYLLNFTIRTYVRAVILRQTN